MYFSNVKKKYILFLSTKKDCEKQMNQKTKNILPGLGLSFIVAGISKIIAIWIPSIGAATIAILLGILLGNTFFKQPFLSKGTKLAESLLLELSIVLLGTTVTFQTIAHMGFNGIGFIIFQMAGTIVGVYLIGKKMNFSKKMSLLMAGGNAVCGSSAIGAIAPEIEASDEEKGQIITLVNLLGTVLMLTLPFIATSVFSDVLTQSALIGGTLQSVGQVVASASMVSKEVVEFSTLFKIMRIIMLVVVVFCFSKFTEKDRVKTINEVTDVKTKKKLPLPWYIIGFLFFCTVNSFVHLPEEISQGAHFVSGWFEITALAAIGLRLDFAKFFKEGVRFLIYALLVGILQIVLALSLIYVFQI
ncbi:YeiH family protein [Vagococcus carniphilus]|uniref:YeiH family protein n=1 Tax=Vagococcus carniphilus TaxID=218144 RepID=UPI0035DFA62D